MSKNKIGKVVIMTDEELEKLRDKITESPSTLPYGHHSGSALIKPEDKGKIKGQAVTAMHEQSHRQLSKIYEQVKLLLHQAEEVKQRVDISEMIYQSEMKFKPVIGHVYHLYQRGETDWVMSAIAPNEWGKSLPYEAHLASVKLLSDHTWEVVEGEL